MGTIPDGILFALDLLAFQAEKNLTRKSLITLLLTLVPIAGHAYSTETLPTGVRSAQLQMGWIGGLNQTYASNGGLYSLGDQKSITFDAATLARVNVEAQTLISALNAFGSGSLGSKIHLGTLRIDTRPEVKYTAPVLAYGINDRWTLGFGVPLVQYRNTISLGSEKSNLEYYRQLTGLNEQLDRALNIDLVAEAQSTLASKGYRTLSDRDESYLGDLQVALLHGFNAWTNVEFRHQMTLVLPTGPRYDADDLMSLNQFGRTSIENSLVFGVPLAGRWTFRGYGSLLVPLPDQVTMRVPKDELDTLPDSSQKQDVTRVLGVRRSLGGELELQVSRALSIGGGYEYAMKDQDRYSGDGRTDLLSKDTSATAHRVRGTVMYSTVPAFKRNEIAVPAQAALDISDTFAGLNVERQTKAELTLMLFF